MNLFVDMDGVLADFAQHHQAVFGWRPDEEDEVDWAVEREVKDFHLNIPPMAELELLWSRIERYHPIVPDWRSRGDRGGARRQTRLGEQTSRSRGRGPLLSVEQKMDACAARRHPDRRHRQAPQTLGQSWWNLGNAPQRRGTVAILDVMGM